MIAKGEELVGFSFSPQVREYFSRFKSIEVGNDVFGMFDGDFSLKYGGAVETTLLHRKDWNLPEKRLVIYDYEYECFVAHLDFSQCDENGEPPVIEVVYEGTEWVFARKVAEDFGDFLLELVEEQIEIAKSYGELE